jgi:hypothetical protein
VQALGSIPSITERKKVAVLERLSLLRAKNFKLRQQIREEERKITKPKLNGQMPHWLFSALCWVFIYPLSKKKKKKKCIYPPDYSS